MKIWRFTVGAGKRTDPLDWKSSSLVHLARYNQNYGQLVYRALFKHGNYWINLSYWRSRTEAAKQLETTCRQWYWDAKGKLTYYRGN